MKTFLLIILFYQSFSCVHNTKELWTSEYRYEYVKATYLSPDKGLIIIGENKNYIITKNFREIISLSKDHSISLEKTSLSINSAGKFDGKVVFLKGSTTKSISVYGHTIDVEYDRGKVKSFPKNSSNKIRFTTSLDTKEHIKRVIKTPITITADAAGTAIVGSIIIVFYPVVIFTGVGGLSFGM